MPETKCDDRSHFYTAITLSFVGGICVVVAAAVGFIFQTKNSVDFESQITRTHTHIQITQHQPRSDMFDKN